MFTLALLGLAVAAHASEAVIRLAPEDGGRTFEGIGAVSAGASTRHLVDYPAKERGEVLDFLFRPKFGASLQHLKVEIGGGENSTCGSEPSHAMTRAELKRPRARGYEFWLMAEARRRNPGILLDALPWCYPGWIQGRFSPDAAEWFAAFLDVARRDYGLELDWVAAAQNEMGTDLNWVAHTLRPTLDRRGYAKVKLQGPDDARSPKWTIFEEFPKDPAYDRVLRAVGYHYPSHWLPELENDQDAVPEAVKATGKPLWASEEFSRSGRTWDDALLWARLINKNYIRDRLTKTEAWAPVDAINPGIMWEGTGLMQASQPWSGHYEVWPAVWTTAHTTQFAEPGWRYLDSACGRFSPTTWKGSHVALWDPATGDWSAVICTDGAREVTLEIGPGLKDGPVHVWRSTAAEQFVAEPDVPVKGGRVSLALEANAVYTLTTTTGQTKGAHPPSPAARAFPFPYREDFEGYPGGVTPRYLSDQKGTFETVARPGEGVWLRQIMPEPGIPWFAKYRVPFTVWGEKTWGDVTVSARVRLAGGAVELGGRYGRTGVTDFRDADLHEPRVELRADGAWRLLRPEFVEDAKKPGVWRARTRALAEGRLEGFDPKAWHRVAVTFAGKTMRAEIDGRALGPVPIAGRANGLAFLASSHDPNEFDDLAVGPGDAPGAARGLRGRE